MSIHSFWVPEMRQKQDAVPGLTTQLAITPTRLGTYPVICAELCGLGHALMRSQAIVMRPAAFAAWVRQEQKGTATTSRQPGRTVFLSNGCGSCHTLSAAGSAAKVGPDLDTLSAEAERAGKPLVAFIRKSIVNPDAYVERGYPANVMPKTFAQLPRSQLDALVRFLVSAQGGTGR